MPYSPYTREERDTLQTMEAMRLPKYCIAVIVGKHISSVYWEFARNGDGGKYTAADAREPAGQRRLQTKPRPKTGNTALMGAVKKLFKEDRSPDQIAGRLAREKPGKSEKHVSHETIYRYLYGETVKEPEMKAHFRRPRRSRPGGKDLRRLR